MNWRKDEQLPSKFEQDRPVFLDLPNEYQSIWNGHLGRIDVGRHHVGLYKDKVMSVNSASYRAGPKGKQFTAVETNRMIAENVIETVTMKWAAATVPTQRKDSSLCLCVVYLNPNAVTIGKIVTSLLHG